MTFLYSNHVMVNEFSQLRTERKVGVDDERLTTHSIAVLKGHTTKAAGGRIGWWTTFQSIVSYNHKYLQKTY